MEEVRDESMLPDLEPGWGVRLPDLENKHVQLEEGSAENLREQAEFAMRGINNDEEIQIPFKVGKSGDHEQLRNDVSQADEDKRVRQAQEEALLAAGSPITEPKDMAYYMQEAMNAYGKRVTAIEHSFIEHESNAADGEPTKRMSRANNYDFIQQNKADVTRALVVQNSLAVVNAKAAEDAGVGSVLGTIGKSIAGLDLVAKYSVDGGYLAKLKDIRAQIATMPVDDIPAFMEDYAADLYEQQILIHDTAYVARVMNDLGYTDEQVSDAMGWDAVEAAGFIFDVGTTVKGIKSIVHARAAAGNVSGAAATIVNNASNPSTAPSAAAAAATLTPSSNPLLAPLSPAVQKQMAKQQDMLDAVFTRSVVPDMLAGSEQSQAATQVAKQAASQFKGGEVAQVAPDVNNTWSVLMMETGGNEFHSVQAALVAGRNAGLPQVSAVSGPNGGYLLKSRMTLDQFNMPVGIDQAAQNKSVMTMYVDNIDNMIDPILVSQARQSGSASSQIANAVQSVYKKSWGKLNKGQTTAVERVLKQQRDFDNRKGTWFTEDEFTQRYAGLNNKPPTEKEIQAFHTYRQLNDFDYHLTNNAIYTQAQQHGYSTLKLGDTEFNGKVITHMKGGNRVFDKSANKIVPFHKVEDGKLLVEVDQNHIGVLLAEGKMPAPVPHVLVDVAEITSRTLEPKQLVYRQGGRGVIDKSNRHFVRQKNTGSYTDGSTYRLPDTTMYGATSRHAAAAKAKQINDGLAVIRDKNLSDVDMDAALHQLGLGSKADFDDLVKAKHIDVDVDVATTRDREMVHSEATNFTTVDDDALALPRATYNQRRAAVELDHVDGGKVAYQDPFAATFTSLDMHAKMASYQNFKSSAMLRFQNTWGAHLDVKPGAPQAEYLKAEVLINSTLKETERNALVAHQKYLKAIMMHQTPTERKWQATIEKMVDGFMDSKAGSYAGRHIPNYEKIMASTEEALRHSPVQRIKSLVFHMKLGMFNLGSTLMQASQAPIVAAVSPVYGTKALASTTFLRPLLWADDAMLKTAEVGLKKAGLWSKDFGSLPTFIDDFKRLGFNDFGNQLAEIGGASSVRKPGVWKKIGNFGKLPFDEGERIPRLTAFGIARAEYIAKHPGVNPSSKVAIATIQDRTHTLMLGMTGSDIQLGMRGAMSIPTQFMSYPVRATSALLGHTFTKAEKARMVLAQSVMFGAAGVPAVSTLSDWYRRNHGEEMNPEAEKLLTSGLFDSMMYAWSDGELDTAFGRRAGIGQFYTDWMKNIMDRNVTEIMMGASGNTSKNFFGALWGVGEAFAAFASPDPDQPIMSAVRPLLKEFTGFSKLYQAHSAHQLGFLLDKHNTRHAPVTQAESIAMVFGAPPQVYTDINSMYISETNKREYVKDATKHIQYLIEKRMTLADPIKIEENQQMIRALSLIYKENGTWAEVRSNVSANAFAKKSNFHQKLEGKHAEQVKRAEKQFYDPNIGDK